jgi:hypothetical protein
MVDCFDRIAVQMTEIALEPVRLLAQRAMLASVSLRTPSGGRLFEITIAKRLPEGPAGKPAYVWEVCEIDRAGEPLAGGEPCRSTPDMVHGNPEDAYWAAVNGLCRLTTRVHP